MKLIACAILFLTVVLSHIDALKCWRCSSDGMTSCTDPFDPITIDEQQRRWTYVDCSFPPGTEQPFGFTSTSRPVCKKMKQLINDKTVISRSCSWETTGIPADSCMKTVTPSYIRTEFCETCDTDGCNGEPMNKSVLCKWWS